MAGLADDRRIVGLVAGDAIGHGSDRGGFGHGTELSNIAVAHAALHSGLEMRAMAPVHARSELVDADPGNRLARFGEFGERLNGGLIFSYIDMALHAFGGGGEGHHIAGIGVDVAILAFESQGQMSLVAIRQGLFRGGVRREIIGYLLLSLLRAGKR